MRLEYSASDALAFVKQNATRHWTAGGADSVAARINAGTYFHVRHEPKFKLDRTAKIFTVGSCFARNVEHELRRLGVPMALSGHGIPPQNFLDWDEEAQTGGDHHVRDGLSPRAFNKYDAHAILHEFRRALTDVVYPDEGLIELYPDRWFDPHASVLKLVPLPQALENRARIAAATAEVRDSKVVLMTLGLTEGWIDKQTGLAMNEHPGMRELMKFSHRFQFVDCGYEEVLDAMDETIRLILDHANPDMKFIVTVSPVTLWMTFQKTDVVVSNTGSKSVLRAVAGTLARRYDCVDYFPSYEMVMNTPRALAWLADQHHVAPQMVAEIMQVFRDAYF